MIHKVTVSKNTGIEEKHGAFNDFPDNFREITEKEMASRTPMGTYTPEHIEYRQMCRKGTGEFENGRVHAHLYHFHDGTGVAMEVDCWGVGYYPAKDRQENYKGQHIRWYAFGCKHKMRGMTRKELDDRKVSLWPCMHASICEKCDYHQVVDSSD